MLLIHTKDLKRVRNGASTGGAGVSNAGRVVLVLVPVLALLMVLVPVLVVSVEWRCWWWCGVRL